MSVEELHYPMSCPFCGRFPVTGKAPSKPSMFVMRCDCGAHGPPKMLPGEAARAWDEVHFRRRMTDKDLRPGDDDDSPEPSPSPVTPKIPEAA